MYINAFHINAFHDLVTGTIADLGPVDLSTLPIYSSGQLMPPAGLDHYVLTRAFPRSQIFHCESLWMITRQQILNARDGGKFGILDAIISSRREGYLQLCANLDEQLGKQPGRFTILDIDEQVCRDARCFNATVGYIDLIYG